jgi:threonine synthase
MIDEPDGARDRLEFLNDHARVVCLVCGREAMPGAFFRGCARCDIEAPLTVDYAPTPGAGLGPGEAVREVRERYALFALVEGVSHRRAPTPLDPAPSLGRGVYLKHETFSLTGSHKDRYNAVAAKVARRLGARGVVASSTGNHGVSVAAHAAAANLPSVIFCHPEAPAGLLRAIGAFRGVAAQLEPGAQRAALVALVEAGWFPATSMDPILSGAANPFAAEGYREIAYETVEQLGEMPAAVFIPTAGGDTYYGIAKGFAEVAALAGVPMPVVFAIQPEGANALSRSLAAGRQIALERPASIALSIADPMSGRQAMLALERWGGQSLDVAEAAIHAAIVDLAGMGIYADPASAAALAGYRQAGATELIPAEAKVVLLLTSSGFKWPDAMAAVFPAGAVQSVDELRRRLAERSGPVERVGAPDEARHLLTRRD